MKWFLCILCCCCCCVLSNSNIRQRHSFRSTSIATASIPSYEQVKHIIHNVWGIFDAILMNDNFCSHLPFSPFVVVAVLSVAIFEGVYIFYCIFFSLRCRAHTVQLLFMTFDIKARHPQPANFDSPRNSTARDDSFFYHSRREAQLALLMLRESVSRKKVEHWLMGFYAMQF